MFENVLGIEYLSFSSGGARGLLFIGALRAIHAALGTEAYVKWRATIHGVSGCSCGSIMALGFCLNLELLPDAEFVHAFEHIFRIPNMEQLAHEYGADDGKGLVTVLQQMLMQGGLSPYATMRDVHRFLRIDLAILTTNLSRQCSETITAKTHPDTLVTDAILASCAIPLIFRPVKLNGELHADGYLTCSLPHVFPVEHTLFLKVQQRDCVQVTSWLSYINGIVSSISAGQRIEDVLGKDARLIELRTCHPVFQFAYRRSDLSAIAAEGFVQMLSFVHRVSVSHAAGVASRAYAELVYLTCRSWEDEASPAEFASPA